jgi:hypothetical protein
VARAPKSLKDVDKQPVVGGWYRLLEPIGSGPGHLSVTHFAGEEERERHVQVVAIPEPGTAGTGRVSEASPLVRWFQHTPEGVCEHISQVPMEMFRARVAPGQEPPEHEVVEARKRGA